LYGNLYAVGWGLGGGGPAGFVSIHANASHNVAARGVETYYHSRTTNDRGMRRLVRAENGGRDGKERSASSSRAASTGSGLSKVSLSTSSSSLPDRRPESIRLARAVQGELVRQLGMRYEAVRDLGAKEGPFFVIGDNAAPSVLVEAAFLTHREEGLRMRSEVYREQIADGVARGIVAFLDLEFRGQQSPEQQRRAGTL
jgi:N-acetylmuramoyl-L-alanine amidase